MVALLVSTGSAFADHDGKGGGNNNDGRSGGNNNNNNQSSGSSRSSSGGSDRSFSRSNFSDGNKGSSSSQNTFRGRGSDDSNKNMQAPNQTFQFKQDGSNSRDYTVRRPTDGQGNDFFKQNPNFNADKFKNRSPKDRDLVDREFNNWRNSWNGDKNNKGDKPNVGKGSFDNRDWTGSWKNSDRFTTADRIRSDWRNRKGNDFVFNDNWWNGKHRGNYWNFWGNYGRRYNNPYYWWGWTTGPRLGTWLTFSWGAPYYWDYGPGEYIYCDNGAIYVNGRWYEPAPVFYNQTAQIIDQNPPLTADAAAKLDWMPLGVFAATPDGLNESNVTVQLAVTKDGLIGGTAFDSKTGAAFNIQGNVDKKTQRAVWSYTNDQNNRVMMETSVYNLTQPEATGMVHYSPTDMRTVELVRLQQPDAAGATAPPTLPAPVSSP
jgi:hypothetical protein